MSGLFCFLMSSKVRRPVKRFLTKDGRVGVFSVDLSFSPFLLWSVKHGERSCISLKLAIINSVPPWLFLLPYLRFRESHKSVNHGGTEEGRKERIC